MEVANGHSALAFAEVNDVGLKQLGERNMLSTTLPADAREQFFNGRSVGHIHEVATRLAEITTLYALMVDLDPGTLHAGNRYFPPVDDPVGFWHGVKPVLDRHPILHDAEVRVSGRGLHLLVHLESALELQSSDDQVKWDVRARVLQSTVPCDPNMPGLTALTRPLGSANSKCGRTVERLASGRLVAIEAVKAYCDEVVKAPFRAVAALLLGSSERVSPCPKCLGDRSRMTVLARNGRCYRCGVVTVADLFDQVMLRDQESVADQNRLEETGR
jgi:hypothetical protein